MFRRRVDSVDAALGLMALIRVVAGQVDDALRAQLCEGLPARVQGMAEALVSEWEIAVEAVPALARAASDEVVALLRLDPPDREKRLRARWARLHAAEGTPATTDATDSQRPHLVSPVEG